MVPVSDVGSWRLSTLIFIPGPARGPRRPTPFYQPASNQIPGTGASKSVKAISFDRGSVSPLFGALVARPRPLGSLLTNSLTPAYRHPFTSTPQMRFQADGRMIISCVARAAVDGGPLKARPHLAGTAKIAEK